ncbi:zinc finger MYM-type protein 1-like [Acyrthosiphon pisum]|uniref:Zinc finger MYM-type protein 1-like n=1 Tax=Acyrthosiphon pisum TaxID=7029 RepID=A0A8R2B2G2_ACYPI|nr:zinc finger MYM-type protein 1-like [Acyrthosiphon pisum]|eukprot:XP_008178490.1 PREDICTED: zinc finger MYM-type protein 1-like [Acyrthosiphon pisum]
MYKRKYKAGSEKRKEKEKQKLLKCAYDKSQKKLSFSSSVKDTTESMVSTESQSIDMNPISKLATSTITTNTTESISDMEPNSISAESTLTSSSLAFLLDPLTLSDSQKVQRKWLSYCSYSKRIFCTTCMTFCPRRENISNLVTGLEVLNSKNVYGTVKKHEQSKTHGEAVSALLQANLNKNIESCININLREIHSKEVEFNRLVIKRLIDIIMFIGRQGLAFRGKDEAAYSLEDRTINHGNFLELVLLIKDYDVVLNMHVKNCIELSKKRKAGVIGNLLREKIVNELKEAQSFSILVDSTQDVAVLDQLAICVRYVLKNNVYEKLLKLVVAYDSSGIGLYNLIAKEFSEIDLDMNKIVGCSFDGASNMKGVYNGLQSHLKKNANPSCIYTHCLGHVLNLVMVDSSECCKNAEFLFGLVQQSATFLLDSHKRMKVWSDLTKQTHKSHDKLRKLNLIGATRWWSKDKALSSIIQFNEPNVKDSRFLLFLHFLLEITSSESKFDAKTKYTAHTLLQNWSKFEIILTAAIYLDIFTISSPVSKIKNKFSKNSVSRVPKINKMPGELASDERPDVSTEKRFKVETYNYILDIMINSMEKRFVSNSELLKDCICLDPKNFKNIKSGLPENSLLKLSELTKISVHVLTSELQQFAIQYDTITKNFNDTFSKNDLSFDNDSNSESELNIDHSLECNTCNNCLRCAFNILYEIVQQSGSFNNIYLAYKFVLTLPCTQVTCERIFSKVKNIKTKLRSLISQDIMEALLMINIERDYVVDKEIVVNTIAKSSTELSRLLI